MDKFVIKLWHFKLILDPLYADETSCKKSKNVNALIFIKLGKLHSELLLAHKLQSFSTKIARVHFKPICYCNFMQKKSEKFWVPIFQKIWKTLSRARIVFSQLSKKNFWFIFTVSYNNICFGKGTFIMVNYFLAYLAQDQMLNMSHSKTNQKTLHVV